MLLHLPSIIYAFTLSNLLQILPIILIFVIIAYIAQPTQIRVNDEFVTISGFYGKKIDFRKIKYVELSDSIPPILLRTNGLGLGPVKKGFFQLKDIGRCRLFLNGNYTPYLIIETIDNEIIILNNKDQEYLFSIYSAIKRRI